MTIPPLFITVQEEESKRRASPEGVVMTAFSKRDEANCSNLWQQFAQKWNKSEVHEKFMNIL
jgi:hypothetical protein